MLFRSLGDSKCSLDLAPFTFSETVTAVIDNSLFEITNTNTLASNGWYADGLVKWTSGNNNGRNMEVKNWTLSTTAVELKWPMPREIQVGDTLDIVTGCDKKLATCRDKFDNIVNRRAWDFVPGVNGLMQTPSASG